MIPRPDDFEAIARRREGRLSEIPFAVLLLAHFRTERSLALELKRGPVAKRISLEAGIPVDCRSNLAHETLGRHLVSANRLSDEDFHSSLALSAAREVPLGEILLERSLIGAEELFRFLQQNLAKKLLDLFTWTDGEFRVVDERIAADSSLRVRVPQLILTGVVRFAPPEQVAAAVAPLVGKTLSLEPESVELLSELKLNEAQAQICVALRPGLRIDQLAETTRLSYEEISRDLYALALLGVVHAGDRPATRPIPTKVAPSPQAAPSAPEIPSAAPPPRAPSEPQRTPSPPPPSPAVDEKRREELMQLFLSYRRLDPFDLLALPEDAPPRAIDLKYLELSERCAPWNYSGDLQEKAREVFLAVARAYSQLADTEQRTALAFRRRNLREVYADFLLHYNWAKAFPPIAGDVHAKELGAAHELVLPGRVVPWTLPFVDGDKLGLRRSDRVSGGGFQIARAYHITNQLDASSGQRADLEVRLGIQANAPSEESMLVVFPYKDGTRPPLVGNSRNPILLENWQDHIGAVVWAVDMTLNGNWPLTTTAEVKPKKKDDTDTKSTGKVGSQVCKFLERKETRWEEMESGTWSVTFKPTAIELTNAESGRTLAVSFTRPPETLRIGQDVPFEVTCNAAAGFNEQGAIGNLWQTTQTFGDVEFVNFSGGPLSCQADSNLLSRRSSVVASFGGPPSGEPPGKRELVKLRVKAVVGSNYYYLFLGWWYDCR